MGVLTLFMFLFALKLAVKNVSLYLESICETWKGAMTNCQFKENANHRPKQAYTYLCENKDYVWKQTHLNVYIYT